MKFKYFISCFFIFNLMVGCSSKKTNTLDPLIVKSRFESKFNNYEFISTEIIENKNGTVNVTIKYKKPESNKIHLATQIFIQNENNWITVDDVESQIIRPLPPLIDKLKEQALRDLKARNIKIDTVLYQFDNLMTPVGGRKVVLDIIYNGLSIVDSTTYIQEGEKITLVLNE